MSDWSYPLCGCFGDCTTCLLTWFCPCIVIGRNAESVGESKIGCCLGSLLAFYFFWPGYLIIRTMLRNKVRESKGIDGTMLHDCLCIWFCDFCALVQEAREVESPGNQMMLRE